MNWDIYFNPLPFISSCLSVYKQKEENQMQGTQVAGIFFFRMLTFLLRIFGQEMSWKGPILIAGHPCDSYREEEFNSTTIHWVPIVCWSLYRVPAVQSCIIITPDLKKFLNIIEGTEIMQIVKTM